MRFPEPVIDVSRDKAVKIAIQRGARWLFFIDSDVVAPVDTLERLIAHNKPIVGGLYVRRHNPPFNEMLRQMPNGMLRPIQDGEYTPGELVSCDAIATGCMLIDTQIFEKMQPYNIVVDGQQVYPQWFFWTENRLPLGRSEDFSFCGKARQFGIEIFCDTSIVCKHIGPIKFLPSFSNSLNIEFMGQGM